MTKHCNIPSAGSGSNRFLLSYRCESPLEKIYIQHSHYDQELQINIQFNLTNMLGNDCMRTDCGGQNKKMLTYKSCVPKWPFGIQGLSPKNRNNPGKPECLTTLSIAVW